MNIRPELGEKVAERFKEEVKRVRKYKVRELCLITHSIDEGFVKEYVEPFFTHVRLIVDSSSLERDRRRQAGLWRTLAELSRVYKKRLLVRQRANVYATLLLASTRRGARFGMLVDVPAWASLWGQEAGPWLTMFTSDESELAFLQQSFDELFKSAKLVKLRKAKLEG